LACAIAPDAQIDIIGIRPGEKLHEDLLSEDEARNAVERNGMYIIKPPETLWNRNQHYQGQPLPEGFTYTSDNNSEWLDVEGIKKYIAPFEEAFANGTLEG
jgi:UDP-N-acetylglucosamine 4,6-dehydratase/5-epimerase